MHKCLVTLFMTTALPMALAANAFDGKWAVSFGPSSRSWVRVIIIDGKGTWILFAPSTYVMQNFCANKALPLVVKAESDTEVVLEVDGNSVLKGCLTGAVILHPGADGTWTGTFESGLATVWTRE